MMDQRNIDMLHEKLVKFKEHRWHDHNERDLPPALMGVWRNSGQVNFGLSAFADLAGEHARLGDLIRYAVQTACGMSLEVNGHKIPPPPDFMVKVRPGDRLEELYFTTESYVRTSSTMEEGEVIQHGDLSTDFKMNPATKVTEQLQMTVWTRDAVGGVDTQTVSQPFSIDDGGVILWGERCNYDETDIGGDVQNKVLPLFEEFS